MKFWICAACGQVVFDRRNHRQPYLMEFNTEAPGMNDLVKCPKCGAVDRHQTAVRSGKARWAPSRYAAVNDVGWRCNKCGHEWGFEVFKEAQE